MTIRIGYFIALGIFNSVLMFTASSSHAQTTELKTEYLMTYVALLEPPNAVDNSLIIVNVTPGGWAKGPKINGKFISPGADWLRIMPSGVL